MVRDPDARMTRTTTEHVITRARRVLRWLNEPLPPPPQRLRRGPLRPGAFPSPLRSARLTAVLGIALGVAFGVCFVTGVLSHLIQQPPGWFRWPSRPSGLYRFTQGLHVATGLATFPLLGAKLWSVFPRLFAWPPVRHAAHGAERLAVAALVSAALFQLVTGLLNITGRYALMPFYFPAAHYWVAWLAMGALLIHIGARLPTVRTALRRPPHGCATVSRPGAVAASGGPGIRAETPGETGDGPRRRLLIAAGAAAAVITVTTAGQTVRPLAGISLLAPRRPDDGPQGLPVNRTAAAAGVRDAALDPGYRLTVTGFGREVSLSLADLTGLRQHTVRLPIACVEGWSATGTWSGVRLRDLAVLVGGDPGACVAVVESLQAAGRNRSSVVAPPHVADRLTLVALRLGGEALALDHGFPARLIAPNRPGVMQTKWLTRITLRETR
ncbi:molybdopterin-dependent oxidoreductase [Actinoplanes sp. NPDC049802]|uniref:molybdopterin-dependent oxidoreductase n=1 Tax=Actinoplanes sp. NPDC049802 TaxID=3154742 RepID=UPI0033DD92F9